MFTTNLKIKDGLSRWAESLPALFRRRPTSPEPAAVPRPEPRTEGERALYQAMGWKDSAWED